ncbi:MAG: MATE family efflux transporter [bacterium]|nr:MATE family efflux transporter [bacterium]MCM1423703.1 MATE family efflux transporter [bacterium]
MGTKEKAQGTLYSNADLAKLILPLIMEQFLAILVGMLDTVMISGVGEAAVSGVSLVDNINILVINIFSALATGGAVVAGHALGQKNREQAGRSAWQMVLFLLYTSVATTIILVGGHRAILRAVFGQVEEAVMESAATYLIITGLSICPLALYNGCAALFRAMGDSRTTMYISLLMNLINLVGNAILIFLCNMGVAGAAIATLAARTVAAVLIFGMMLHEKRDIHFKGRLTPRADFSLIRKILYIGVPNGLENSLFQLGKILLLSLVSTFGTSAIAANAVCGTITNFNILPGMAIGMALLSVSSVCIGAGEIAQVRYYTKKMMRITWLCISGVSLVMMAGAPLFLKIYHLTPETTTLALQVIRFHALMCMISWVPSFSLPNTLRAAGDVVWTMIIAIVSMWTFRIITAYIFSYALHMGLMGIWIAMTIDWTFRAICYTLRYRGSKWETIMHKRELQGK